MADQPHNPDRPARARPKRKVEMPREELEGPEQPPDVTATPEPPSVEEAAEDARRTIERSRERQRQQQRE
jgi:hypothetical protein